MSTDEIFQNFFDKVLEPAITKAVSKAVKDTMLQQSKDLIDLAEAARILNVSTRTIFRYCDEGPLESRLPFTMPDGKRLFDREAVINYKRKNTPIRYKQRRRK